MTKQCIAWNKGLTDILPVKKGKKLSRNRHFNYLHIVFGETTFIRQRQGNDIWKGLYEFPLIETTDETGFTELARTEPFIRLLGSSSFTLTDTLKLSQHKLTHQTIHPVFFRVTIQSAGPVLNNDYIQIDRRDIHHFAISRLTEKYLDFFHNFAAL